MDVSRIARTAEHERPREVRQPVLLQLAGVSKAYGKDEAYRWALRDVSLAVAAGELVALVGHSGSGKSTLLNIVGGLERPTEGRVLVGDVDVARLDEERLARHRLQSVAYVFQDYNLLRTLTVLENVALPLELRGVRGPEAAYRAYHALGRVGISSGLDRFPDQLSGGEQQRASIARAMVAIVERGALLLADEPTGALDSRNGAAVVALLRAAVCEGATCLVATHNADVARAADRVIELRDGRIADSAFATGASG